MTEKTDKRREGERAEVRYLEGDLPQTAEEGGLVKEGTGDFSPEKADEVAEPEIGADGVNPVTPQNPPRKALLGIDKDRLPRSHAVMEEDRKAKGQGETKKSEPESERKPAKKSE